MWKDIPKIGGSWNAQKMPRKCYFLYAQVNFMKKTIKVVTNLVGLLNTWIARLPRRVRLTSTKLGVNQFRSGNSQSITEVTPKDNTTNINEKCCVSVFCACLVSDGGDPSVLQARLSRDWQRGLEITSGRAFAFSSPLTPRPSSWHRHGVTQAFPYILQSFIGVIQKQTPVFETSS